MGITLTDYQPLLGCTKWMPFTITYSDWHECEIQDWLEHVGDDNSTNTDDSDHPDDASMGSSQYLDMDYADDEHSMEGNQHVEENMPLIGNDGDIQPEPNDLGVNHEPNDDKSNNGDNDEASIGSDSSESTGVGSNSSESTGVDEHLAEVPPGPLPDGNEGDVPHAEQQRNDQHQVMGVPPGDEQGNTATEQEMFEAAEALGRDMATGNASDQHSQCNVH